MRPLTPNEENMRREMNESLQQQFVHSDTIEGIHIPFRELMITLHRGRDEALLIRIEGSSWEQLEWLEGLTAVLHRDPDSQNMPTCGTSELRADDSRIGYYGYFHTVEPEWGNCVVQIYNR